MERKSDMVRRLVSEGDYRKALSIVKSFRLGITKEQHNSMILAYECMIHPNFYTSIGITPPKAIEEGISVLTSLYG